MAIEILSLSLSPTPTPSPTMQEALFVTLKTMTFFMFAFYCTAISMATVLFDTSIVQK